MTTMPRRSLDHFGTEFILVVRRATTGDVLLRNEVAAMEFDYTWKLKLRLANLLGVLSPFELRLLKNTEELEDLQMLRTYVQGGYLEVDVITQARRSCTRRDEYRIGELSGLQQASQLWLFLSQGSRVPSLLRIGRQRVSPLIMAINSPYLEDEERETPGTVEILLLGNCDPNELGRPEVSPFTSALRIMDTDIVWQLWLFRANPNITARGDHLPIFSAITRQNVSAVQALVAARANLQVRSFVTPPRTRGALGRPTWCGQTPVEMAHGNGAILRELRAAERGDEVETCTDEAEWER